MTFQQVRPHSGFAANFPKAPLWARLFSSDFFTICGGAALVVLIPALFDFRALELRTPVQLIGDSSLEQLAAFVIGVLLVGRFSAHPSVTSLRYVLPVFTVTYGGAVAVELFSRGAYSGQQILASYLLALMWCFATYTMRRRIGRPSMAVVPVGRFEDLAEIDDADWTVLDNPQTLSVQQYSAVVADLHADLGPGWEAFLARTALSGVPIFHTTQVCESMTGRTQIEHLSENVIGSLVPNTIYAKAKVAIDVLSALAALLVLGPVMMAIAALIRFDSPGSAMFTQQRVGYRGRNFTIYKFRTMYDEMSLGQSFTAEDDPRITQIGGFLRRTRLDELPQILNILRGEMSWIGPRPMAMDLNEWYQSEIPFFEYRHIVRPGISGWAQVQQGYADEIEGATEKLYYDFYYIKNFSLWLDILICVKTVCTLASGNGAR